MFDNWREVWAVDFEFTAPTGEQPSPVCLVGHELKSGKVTRLWRDQFGPVPPYPVDADCLFVAYYASAELGCHLTLGWPLPARILDLYAEFRNQTNGLPTVAGRSLVGALAAHGLDSIGTDEKTEMRDLVMRGGPSDDERAAVLDYCDPTLMRWRGCYRRFCQRLTCRARWCVAAICARPRASRAPACPSTWKCWRCCARTGPTFRTN